MLLFFIILAVVFLCFVLISIFMNPYISVFQTQTQRSRKNENTKEGQAGQCITCVPVRHSVRVPSICLSHFHRHQHHF